MNKPDVKKIFGESPDYKIGNDLVFLPDFYAMLNDAFINRVYTQVEKEYANQFDTPSLRFASTFSVKEAIYKVVKQVFPNETLAFNKIEITRNRAAGKPSCRILYPHLQHLEISISITHDGDYVWAMALLKTQK
ncbi:holo-ACP synthase [Zobellia laminariae]|uniref:4'-phosphopantetheinyl transferase superfamily protein n=1 Tax=Zobellia laminariae TaxID=248906 RepID=UPI0012D937CA|nr:4'-phosphopantetheinyl transferase superfamily protein [Zobellia laminariae]